MGYFIMGLFDRVTKADIRELREVIELLDKRIERIQKSTKTLSARDAGLDRRLKVLEDLFRSAEPIDLPEEEEEVDEVPEKEDIETQRLRLRGQ